MDWSPDRNIVAETVGMLQALRDPTSSSHSAAIEVLHTNAQNPSFVLHVVYVFAQARDVPVDIRQLAGLVVKNCVVLADKFCSLDEGVQTLVKRSIIAAISDSDPSVRSTATNLLGGMSRQLPVDAWSDVVGTIIAGLNTSGGSADCMSGSLMALRRLSEDAGEKMAVDCGRFPLVAAVPVLFSACRSSEVSHRRLALDALISLLFVIFDPPPLPLSAGPAPSLTCFVPEYLSTVSFLAADPDPVVRTAVCQAIVLVMTSHADTLTTSLDQICSFMLAATGDVNSNVAIEAAEFWTALADVASSESISPRSDHSMIRYLLRCIPVLLSRMLLTAEQVEADRAQLEAEIAGQKEVHFGQAGGNSIYHHRSKDISGKKGGKRTNDDDGATGDEEEASAEWTVRRQCAGVFDAVCSSGALLPEQILSIALPAAKDMLQSPGDAVTPAWVYVEAGILIIGALANGCSTEMEPHLPVLLPFLCQQVASSEVPEVRSISCWVLGRYAEWSLATLLSVCDTVESEDGDDVLYNPRPYDPSSNCYDLMLSVLLPGIVDKQTKVQSAALSALNAVISGVKGVSENEMCALLTVDRLALIFEQVASASHLTMTPSYGVRNCLILCDLIAAVCEAAGELAATPALVPMYLPFVMHQYLNVFTDDTSVYLFPVMEAITAVLAVVGMQVHVYAVPLLKRSIQIAGSALQAEQEERQERPESNWGSFHLDFVVCAFDVIGALSECLVPAADMAAASIVPTNFSSLLTEVGVNVVLGQMVVAALSIQTEADLLQSAFALCGELFRTAMIALLPASSGGNPVNVVELILGKIVHILSIPDTPLAVASNALWAAGEALMRLRHVSGGILDAFLSAVLPILLHRMVEHVRPVVDYGIDRFGPLATSLTTPPDMDPEADMEIFLESLGAHQNLFLQNAAVTLGRIAVQNMPMFLYYLEQPSESTVNFLQSWYAALSLVSTDMKERNHAFMGLLSVLQAKPDLLQLVSSVGTAGGASRQCLSDSATLLLFGTALAWRQTADLDGEGTDVYLALRGAMLALQAQLNQCRENGLVIDKRLVGVFALFRYLSESFNI